MSLNPTIISQSQELEADRNPLKIIILAVVGMTLSFAAVYFFNRFLLTAGYGDFFRSFLFGGGFLVLTVLQVFTIKSLTKLNFILFLEVLSALAIFYPYFYPQISIPLVAAGFLFFFFLSLGASQGLKLLGNSVKIQSILTAKMIIPKAVTGLLIFLSVILYLDYFKWGKFNDGLGQTLVNQSLIVSKPIFKYLSPEFSPDKTVNQFFLAVSENQLEKLKLRNDITGLDLNYDALSPEEKKQVAGKVAEQLKLSTEKIVGRLNGNDTLNKAIFLGIKNYINNFPPNFTAVFGIVTALVFFAILKSVAVLFYWLIEIVTLIVFKILLISGFAYISIENRSREFILLK